MTLTEITKELETSVKAASDKKAALEVARKTVADLEGAQLAIVQTIKKLHEEYQTIMKDILTLGGTLHR